MNIKDNERGATYVMTILAMVAILGFAALVIDVGMLFIEKQELSNAIDAAVLAGVQELPTYKNRAIEVTKDFATQNGVDPDLIHVVVNDAHTVIRVKVKKQVHFIFARILGFYDSFIEAKAGAMIGPVTAVYDGIRPLVVEQKTLQYGQQVTLKEDAGDGLQGNYGAVSLGATGSKTFEQNIINGFNGKLEVGDLLYTQTGNLSGATLDAVDHINSVDYQTFENYTKDSNRLWTIPVVNTLNVDGHKPIEVVGFAEFFIENAVRNGGHTELIGRFIEFTTNGEISGSQLDYGLKGIRLMQ